MAAEGRQKFPELNEGKRVDEFELKNEEGEIRCRLHRAENGEKAVLWVFGTGGGFGGPAGGVYERMAEEFLRREVTSLQLDYRRPGALEKCIEDVLLGIEYLKEQGKNQIILVGHSFGGAVVISAGIKSAAVIGVAALSSQTKGAENVGEFKKPLLLIHGSDDEILPDSCSIYIYVKAEEPKELLLYGDCRHGLDQCREQLDHDLRKWLLKTFGLETV